MSNKMAMSRLAIWAEAQASEPNDKNFIALLEEVLEQGRTEMRELMECGHPKACWHDINSHTEFEEARACQPCVQNRGGVCVTCAHERRIKQATIDYITARLREPWQPGEIRAINPDDIKVEED